MTVLSPSSLWLRLLVVMVGMAPGIWGGQGAIAQSPQSIDSVTPTSSWPHGWSIGQAPSPAPPPGAGDSTNQPASPDNLPPTTAAPEPSSANSPPVTQPSPNQSSSNQSSPNPSGTSASGTDPADLSILTPSSLIIKGQKGGYWINPRVPALRRNLTIRFNTPPESATVYVTDLKDPSGDKIYASDFILCEQGGSKPNPGEEVQQNDGDATTCNPRQFNLNSGENRLVMHFHFLLYNESGGNQSPSGNQGSDRPTPNSRQLRPAFERPPSGEFNGEILIVTNRGEEIVVPVLLRIQDGWMLPMIILFIGVSMGMVVSAYSAGGRLSDEVTVGLNRLRDQIEKYRDEAKTFASRTETYISDAQSANDAQQLTEAQQAATYAKTVWRKWYRQRAEWEVQFAYHSRLTQQVNEELDHYQSLYMQTISQELDAILRRVPEDYSDPETLRSKLREIANQLREYGQIKTRWNQLKLLVSEEFEHLSPTVQKQINDEVAAVKQVMSNLVPSDQEGVKSLTNQLNALIKTFRESTDEVIAPTLDVVLDSDPEKTDGSPKLVVSQLTMIPSFEARSETNKKRGNTAMDSYWLDQVLKQFKTSIIWPDADGRLRLFYLASYIGSVVVMAAVGFNSLYVENPIFGANIFADYFSLVAWGFGAEATRDTVTKVVRKTDESNR